MFAATIIFHLPNPHLPDVCGICFHRSILKAISLPRPLHPSTSLCPGHDSFIYLFIPQMFREKLLYSRNWFRPWDYKRGPNRPDLCPHAINDLVQGSAHCGLWATSDPSPGFIGKVVLGYSHFRALWTGCGCFRSWRGCCNRVRMATKQTAYCQSLSPCSNGKNSLRPYHLNARNLV